MLVTRIDFIFQKDPRTCAVRKFRDGWEKGNVYPQPDVKTNFDVDEALAWCASHGYTVHKWERGARAWLGDPIPVRDSVGIQALRDLFGVNCGANFAFDW